MPGLIATVALILDRLIHQPPLVLPQLEVVLLPFWRCAQLFVLVDNPFGTKGFVAGSYASVIAQ
jgi:hypothetical protein